MLRLLRWRCMAGLDMGTAVRRCMGTGTTEGMRSRMAMETAMAGGTGTTAMAMTTADGEMAMATGEDGVGTTIVDGAAEMTTADGVAGNTGKRFARPPVMGGLAVLGEVLAGWLLAAGF